ncbi:MAG: arginine deiminase family protein [Bacillota bacterium]
MHFRIETAINEIQKKFLESEKPDAIRAASEHSAFSSHLEELGVKVVRIPPAKAHPYQVNTRDIGVSGPDGVVLGKFRFDIRRGEIDISERALSQANVRIVGRTTRCFEGGDFVYIGPGKAALGVGVRTDPDVVEELTRLLQVDIVTVSFAEEFLHLDMVFNCVAPGICVRCPDALPGDFLSYIDSLGFDSIEVTKEDVFNHACNLLALAPFHVVAPREHPYVTKALRARGVRVDVIDLTEITKSGGGPRCISFPIAREPCST